MAISFCCQVRILHKHIFVKILCTTQMSSFVKKNCELPEDMFSPILSLIDEVVLATPTNATGLHRSGLKVCNKSDES